MTVGVSMTHDKLSMDEYRALKKMAVANYSTSEFGAFIRSRREALKTTSKALSIRKFAAELGIEPAYLSKIERGVFAPPSEDLIIKIANRLGENPDRLLALGGKIASDIKAVILRHPEELSAFLRELDEKPDAQINEVLREVRDGEW